MFKNSPTLPKKTPPYLSNRLTNKSQTRQLDYFLGGGNVAYCSGSGDCHVAYSGNEIDETLLSSSTPNSLDRNPYLEPLRKLLPRPKLKFPNGLTRGLDGLYYVPSAIDGKVRFFKLDTEYNTLRPLGIINVGMPLDNISPDANGDLYAAAFPDLIQAGKAFADPYNEISPVTIWRIRKTVDRRDGVVVSVGYRVEKVLEDRESKVLSGSTTVRHDVKTGRLFISGKLTR